MPFVAWALANAFDLGDTESMALILIGMSPGGVTSTLFTYISGANVTLSLVMTTCSTFIALVMIPLLLFVYVRPPLVSSGNDDTKVSFVAIIATLVVATTPALIGWRIRRKYPATGEKVEKWSTKIGAFLIFGVLLLSFAWPGPGGFTMTAKCFVCMILMCPLGFCLGYSFSFAWAMDSVTCRTVSMETGIQQVGIAGAIAIQSFEDEVLDRTITVMVIFGCATVIFGAIWALILRHACPTPVGKMDVDAKAAEFTNIAPGDAKGEGEYDA